MLSFNQRVRSEKFSRLTNEIANDKPLLKNRQASFSDADIDDYLVMFELLDDVYEEHLITHEMVYDAFSYDIEKAYQNQEIKKFLKDVRDQEHDSGIYGGFEKLAKEMIDEENKKQGR